MPQLWEAERTVSIALAATLIERQFPRLAPVCAEPLGQGWDNTAVLVNRAYVFRFPRRQTAVECLEAELRVLPKIAARRGDALPARSPALVHGDLYASHLLVDERGSVCGVIDWGDVHVGDPAVDLALAHSFLPPPARAVFRRAYGAIDEPTWQLARFRALNHTLLVVVYAHQTGRPDMLRDAIASLAFIAAE